MMNKNESVEVVCFISSEMFIIQGNNPKSLQNAQERAKAVNHAIMLDVVMGSFVSGDQFKSEHTDWINKKIHIPYYDPIVYVRGNLGPQGNYATGYEMFARLSQIYLSENHTIAAILTENG